MNKLYEKLEIFIITYNRCNYLKKTLKSILTSPVKDLKITILDNCSNDKTEQFSRYYSKIFKNIKYIKNNKNIGGNSIHNIDAILKFYDTIFEHNLNNKYFLYICGDVAKNENIQRLKGELGIVLYGYIWNIEDFYNLVDICINPVQIGSGLKIKNIEAISFNKPIVTSTVGIQGMEDELNKGLIFKADNLDEWNNNLEYMSYKPNLDELKVKQFEYNLNNNDLKVYNNLIDIIEKD